ncbi:22903_t:CDS:10, partial [Rhizophagus irregularis]
HFIMATKAAYKRLNKEYITLQKNPPPYLMAKPLESNILEWHYVIRGPPDTPYHNGEYHGVLLFPAEYPFKPPSIRMTTPSGRFQPDTRLCLSMSDFHPSTWNPSWSVATILTGLLSFMTSNEATTGSIKTTDADKRIYASRSHQFNLNDSKFKEIFPELCVPECVPVEVLYPINKSSSSSSDDTTTVCNDALQTDKHALQTVRRNEANQQGPLVDGINQIQQRRPNNRSENPLRGIVAGFGHATRVVQVASEILKLQRKHKLYIISNAPKFIFQGAIDLGAKYRNAPIDAGVKQPRAYTVDRRETIDDLIKFLDNKPIILNKEIQWLKDVKADIVLSDAPFLPCAAAALVGIPSAIVSNFTFDAVYSGLCEGDELDDTIKRLVEHVIKDYRNSELLIRLPGYIPIPSFSGTQLYPDNTITSSSLTSSKGEKTLYNEEKSVNYLSDINSFFSSPNTSKFLKYHRNVIDVPLVVRKSITPKEIVLKNLGIPKEIFTTHKILMVSFGGQNLVGIEDWGTSSLPDNWIAIVCGSDGINLPDRFYSCPKNAYIPDLTNAADAIIGKLGYGTCSECIGHGKPFIYISRPQFIEELGLKRLMELQGICVEMPKSHFESGKWKSYIQKAYDLSLSSSNSVTTIKPLTHDGGFIAANLLENFLDNRNYYFNTLSDDNNSRINDNFYKINTSKVLKNNII